MIMIAIGSTLVGAVFAQRFKVLSLFPMNFVFICFTGMLFAAGMTSGTTAVLAIVAHVVAAQAGYGSGLFLRGILAASRVPARSHSPSPVAPLQAAQLKKYDR